MREIGTKWYNFLEKLCEKYGKHLFFSLIRARTNQQRSRLHHRSINNVRWKLEAEPARLITTRLPVWFCVPINGEIGNTRNAKE